MLPIRKNQNFRKGLIAVGLSPGAPVLVMAQNRPATVLAELALLSAGGVFVPVPLEIDSPSINEIARIVKAQMILVDGPGWERLSELQSELKTDFSHVVFLEDIETTSGPTSIVSSATLKEAAKKVSGERFYRRLQEIREDGTAAIFFDPDRKKNRKGIAFSHRNILEGCSDFTRSVRLSDQDTCLFPQKSLHAFEHTTNFFSVIYAGAKVALTNEVRPFDENLKEIQPTVMAWTAESLREFHSEVQHFMEKKPGPMQFLVNKKTKLLRHIQDRLGSQLRILAVGGHNKDFSASGYFQSLGLNLFTGFVLPEASSFISLNLPNSTKSGTYGLPQPNVEVRFSDKGKIEIKGPIIMSRSFDQESGKEESVNPEGFLSTANEGSVDADGFLTIAAEES